MFAVNRGMNAISLNRALNTSFSIISGIPLSESTSNPNQENQKLEISGDKSGASSPKRSADSVEISAAGRAKAEQSQPFGKYKGFTADNLSEQEKAQVSELQKIDRQTRAHEQAHLGASGGLARGGASFSFAKGPDGRLYAVGGEVSIDTAPVPSDPGATIRKADTIRRAALAPSEPSSQDKAVAAQATKMANEARAEKSQDHQTENYQSEASASDRKSELNSKFLPTSEIGDLLDLVA
jgi:SprA-related family